MFNKYCRRESNRGACSGNECEFCPIQSAYEEICNSEKAGSAIRVTIYDIRWDADGEDDIDLPDKITHTFEGFADIRDEELLDVISDWLTDTYGFCHDNFSVKAAEVQEASAETQGTAAEEKPHADVVENEFSGTI